MSDAADLTEAERTRILAKTARFNPPSIQLADGRRDLVAVGLSKEHTTGREDRFLMAPYNAGRATRCSTTNEWRINEKQNAIGKVA